MLNYKWTFGDEQNPTAVGNGRMVSYTYTTYGDKTVKLTVSYTGTDGKQVEGSDTLKVKVIFIDGERVEPKTVNDGERVEFQVLGAWDATSFAWYSRYPRKAGNELGEGCSNNYHKIFNFPSFNEMQRNRTIYIGQLSKEQNGLHGRIGLVVLKIWLRGAGDRSHCGSC